MVRKVLFVDDDEILQLAVERQLADYDAFFSVLLAKDGLDALKILENASVSLIIIDLLMPRMDGVSLLSHLRERYPDIPVILISTMSMAEMKHLAEAHGVIGRLEKPFRIEELGKCIMSYLQSEAAGGIMHHVSPVTFLQLMEMEGKTCTIRIFDSISEEGGILYFQDGRLLDARIGVLNGMAAVYRVFGWDEVTVFLRNGCPSRENRINSDLQPLIMAALAEKDEADESPLADSEGPVAGFFSLGSEDECASCPPCGGMHQTDAHGYGTHSSCQPENTAAPETDSILDSLKCLLQKEAGEVCGSYDISYAKELDGSVGLLKALGEQYGFGELRVGYVESGEETGRLLVAAPDNQAVIVSVGADCPLNTVLDVLRYRQ